MKLKRLIYLFVVLFLLSCEGNTRETISSEIRIYEWDHYPVPVKAELLQYDKNGFDEKALKSYKKVLLKKGWDTLNKEDYLMLKFDTPGSRLPTKNDYKLIINDTLEYKITEIRTAPATQGGDIFLKTNGNTTMIGDDDILTISRGLK